MPAVDVAILGGGPAGLATALSIQRTCKNLNVKVYERVPKFVPRGAGLRLEVNGVKALQAIDPDLHSKILQQTCNPPTLVQFPGDGKAPVEVPLSFDWERVTKKYGHNHCYIGWSDLQLILAHSLASGTVQFGTSYERFELEDNGSATLIFGSGHEPVTASVVIACDGYRSRLRQQWRNDGPPAFSGAVIWRGRVPNEKSPIKRDYLAVDMRNDMAFMVYPGSEGYVVWNASASVPVMEAAGVQRKQDTHQVSSLQARDQGGLSGEEVKSRALQVFTQQPEPFREIIAATSPDVMLEHDICFRPSWEFPETAFGQEPLTLAGDAAHVIRPTGQGVNQALEDALQLGHVIGTGGATADALREYERVRLPRWKMIAQFSEASADVTYNNRGSLTLEEFAEKLKIEKAKQDDLTWGVQLEPLITAVGSV